MKLSDYVVRFVEGVTDTVFLVSGGGAMHLVDSVGRSGLQAICCHHEQACATAAEGYARMRNDVGVALVTTGPGGTNAITGVASAWVDCIPILVISGQVRTDIMIPREDGRPLLRQLGPQEINIVDVAAPVTKYAVTIEDPATIRYHLEKALHLARSGKPGPVWIDVPLDVQRAEIDGASLEGFAPPPDEAFDLRMADVVAALRRAKRPLMIVGHGVRLAGAADLLRAVLGKLQMNVVSAMSGDDLVTEEYPRYLGRQGITGTPAANRAIDACDLLLIVGTRMQLRQTSFEHERFAKGAVKIMVDVDGEELRKKTLSVDVPVRADARAFLQALLGEDVAPATWDVPAEERIAGEDRPGYVDVYRFMDALSGACDLPIVTTNGMACEATHQAIRLRPGQRLMTNTAFGQMGKGLPMAIGACMANGRKPVVCMEGDGSIMMNVHELETVVHNRLPLKIFLLNNGGYYSIRNTHLNYFGKVFAADPATGVGLPDWSRLAPAWGIPYESIRTNDELRKLAGVLGAEGPALCELVIDPAQPMLPKWSAT